VTYASRSADCAAHTRGAAANNSCHGSGGVNKNARPTAGRSNRCPPRTLLRARLKGQSWEAVQDVLLASRSRFIGLAYAILRNREDAEDAVQDALLSAYLHLRTFEGRSSLSTWFTRIVFNAALVIRRKRKKSRIQSFPESGATDDAPWTESIPASQPDPEMSYAEKETFRLIDILLGEMSPVLRQAFIITYYEEMSGREACAILGVTTGTFKSRLSRARKCLMNQAERSVVVPIRRAMDLPSVRVKKDFSALVARPDEISSLEVAYL